MKDWIKNNPELAGELLQALFLVIAVLVSPMLALLFIALSFAARTVPERALYQYADSQARKAADSDPLTKRQRIADFIIVYALTLERIWYALAFVAVPFIWKLAGGNQLSELGRSEWIAIIAVILFVWGGYKFRKWADRL